MLAEIGVKAYTAHYSRLTAHYERPSLSAERVRFARRWAQFYNYDSESYSR
jgi:hypothetical protein